MPGKIMVCMSICSFLHLSRNKPGCLSVSVGFSAWAFCEKQAFSQVILQINQIVEDFPESEMWYQDWLNVELADLAKSRLTHFIHIKIKNIHCRQRTLCQRQSESSE